MSNTKKCTRCLLVLPTSSFYKKTKDGSCRSACKDCTNARARELHQFKKEAHSLRTKKHYAENKEWYQKKNARYRRSTRGAEVHKRATKKFLESEKGRQSMANSKKKWEENNKHKRNAHWKVKAAIRRGALSRMPCNVCGSVENIGAHHEDYSKPLEVEWLCVKHHKEKHRKVHVDT